MSDRELEEYIRKIDAKFDSHIEKGTIEMSNEYYNLVEERMARLINKNKQLKDKLKGVQEERDYLFNKQSIENKHLALENKQLKDKIKQLEKCYCNRSDCSGRIKDSRKYDSVVQQLDKYKEVIEEVREYIDNNTELEHDGDDYGYTEWVNIKPQNIVFINELLQILDKAKE